MSNESQEPFLVVINSDDGNESESTSDPSPDLCCKDGLYTSAWTFVIVAMIGVWFYVFYLLLRST